MGRGAIRVAVLVGAMLACLAPPAQAAFPGANGKIAFSFFESDGGTAQLCTVNPDGTGATCLTQTNGPVVEHPAWSPDGQRIAYWDWITGHIFTINHDGSSDGAGSVEGEAPSWSPPARGRIVFSSGGLASVKTDFTDFAQLTTHPGDFAADWSPDGSRVAFTRTTGGNREIWVVFVDTGQELRLTSTAVDESSPDFSPDGSKLIFSASNQLHTMNADGTGRAPLPVAGIEPSWSPDGTRIVYQRDDSLNFASLYVANADGSGETWVNTSGCCFDSDRQPDWQPLPVDTASAHARPAGATPFRVPLVPAARECTSGNRTHAPPLAFPSCSPPVPESPHLTVGVGDGDPAPALSIGFVRLSVRPGVPGGADDAEVVIRSRLSNVMRTSDLSEYPGDLRASVVARLTDKQGVVSQTTQDFPLEWQMPCTSTTGTNEGSLCELTTTLDALRPGAAAEGTRAVWALDQVQIYDGGPDEDAATTADNSLFSVQGVFVP